MNKLGDEVGQGCHEAHHMSFNGRGHGDVREGLYFLIGDDGLLECAEELEDTLY